MAEELGDFIEAAGLGSYDPEAITNIYKKNPKRLIKRLWETLVPIFLFLIGTGWDKIVGKLNDDKEIKEKARKFNFIRKGVLYNT